MENASVTNVDDIKEELISLKISTYHETDDQLAHISEFFELLSQDEQERSSKADAIRFLIACNWNAAKAAEMRRHDLNVREYWQLERCLSAPTAYDKSTHALNQILSTGRSNGCFRVDKQGHPVYYASIGEFITMPLYHYVSSLEYERWNITNFERLTQVLKAANANQVLMVFDLDGLALESRHNVHFIHAAGKFNEAHYPEYFCKVVAVNAPSYIPILWGLVKPMLPERTKNKVSFADHKSTKKVLLEHIDKEQLPQRYGGMVPDEECFTEKVDDYQTVLKSMRDQLQTCDGDPTTIQISAGKIDVVTLECKANCRVKWWFKVLHGDVLFQVTWKTHSHSAERQEEDEEKSVTLRTEQRLGKEGYHNLKFPIYDEFLTKTDGTISLHFSNKHSMFTAKTVEYQLQCIAV